MVERQPQHSTTDLVNNMVTRHTHEDDRPISDQGDPSSKTTSTLLTTADILTKIIVGTHTAGTAQSYQLPTGANLDADLGLAIGQAREFSVVNESSVAVDSIALGINTGVTIVGRDFMSGGVVTKEHESGLFRLRKTAADTFICYRIA